MLPREGRSPTSKIGADGVPIAAIWRHVSNHEFSISEICSPRLGSYLVETGLHVRYRPDCVAKLFLGVRTKFSRGAGAFILKSCGGSHDQPVFQPAAFVSSLQGISSPKTRFDGHAAKFWRPLIFEFCNTIGRKADMGGVSFNIR
jgi:hypothetical protein